MVDDVRRVLGPIDVLVNNAGTITMGPVFEMTDADLRESLAVHCIDVQRRIIDRAYACRDNYAQRDRAENRELARTGALASAGLLFA